MRTMLTALGARRDSLKNEEGQKGFTLIELLVVVIIIGILAAIAIPVYLNIQNGARESATKSDLTNAKTAIVAYYTQTPSAAAPTLTGLTNFGYTKSPDTTSLTLETGATSSAFCVDGVSSTTKTFFIDEANEVRAGTCAAGVTP